MIENESHDCLRSSEYNNLSLVHIEDQNVGVTLCMLISNSNPDEGNGLSKLINPHGSVFFNEDFHVEDKD